MASQDAITPRAPIFLAGTLYMLDTHLPDAAVAADEIALADVGELAGPLTHEVNNLLNNLTLHLAVMQQVEPTSLDADLSAIRRQITRFAGIVSRFQRRRQREPGEAPLVDVNAAVADAVRCLQPASILVELDRHLPPVRGHAADIRRLCRFLLANATRAVGPSGPPVLIQTQAAEGVRVTIEDSGPAISEAQLPRIFEPGNECREGMCCLELAACRTLVRRLRGTLNARSQPGDGLTIILTLPAATGQGLPS